MRHRFRAFGVCILSVIMVGFGCDWFEDPSPDFVRVMIDSDAESLMLITSTRFLTTTNERGELGVDVFSSDTTHVSFPFDHSWNIQEDRRFLLLGFPSDSSGATVRVRILLDGDTDFDRTTTILIDDPVRYIYLFNQRVVQDFNLL